MTLKVPFERSVTWLGSSAVPITISGTNPCLVVALLVEVGHSTPTLTRNGTAVTHIGTQSHASAENVIEHYRLLAPTAGTYDLTISGTGIIGGMAQIFSNVASARAVSGVDVNDIGAVPISGIASADGERVVSFIEIDSEADAAASILPVGVLRRRGLIYGSYGTLAGGDKSAGGATESLSWTTDNNLGRAFAYSLTPSNGSIVLPQGNTTIIFLGATTSAINADFDYDGGDAPSGFEYSLNGAAWVQFGTGATRTLTISSGITADTDYTLTVRAYMAAGPGDPSATESVHSEAGSANSVVVVDYDGGYNAQGYGPIDVSFLLTVEGPNPAIFALVAVVPSTSGGSRSVTFNGDSFGSRIDFYSAGSNIWELYRLTTPDIGTFTFEAIDNDEYQENLQAVAISVKNYASHRTIKEQVGSTIVGPTTVESAAGDLLLTLMAMVNGTITGSADQTVHLNRKDASAYTMAIGTRTAVGGTENPTFTITGSSSYRVAYGISLVPTAGGGSGTEAPTGTYDFDAAAWHTGIALRGLDYDGNDADSAGFRPQFRAKVNGGAYSSWTNAVHPYLIDNAGSGHSPEDIITVQMRAANNAGAGDPSAEKSFKVHHSWHESGVARYNPSALIGHIGRQFMDDGADTSQSNEITTGGENRALFATLNFSYGRPSTEAGQLAVTNHAFEYNDVAMVKYSRAWSNLTNVRGFGDPGGGGTYIGGWESHVLANPAVGLHDIDITNPTPADNITIDMVALALYNVDQTNPVAHHVGGGPDIDTALIDNDHIVAPTLIDTIVATPIYSLAAPVSKDETAIVMYGFYHKTADLTAGSNIPNTEGEAEGGINPVGQIVELTDQTAMHSGLPIISGYAGLGTVSSIRQLYGKPNRFPAVFTWFQDRWCDILVTAVRPSPNMLSNLGTVSATPAGIVWSADSAVNHGRVLLALISPLESTNPTGLQVRDQIDHASSSYGGTFIDVDDYGLTTAGAISAGLPGQAQGDYRLVAYYEPWQAFEGGTGQLSDALVLDFSVTALAAQAATPLEARGAVTQAASVRVESKLSRAVALTAQLEAALARSLAGGGVVESGATLATAAPTLIEAVAGIAGAAVASALESLLSLRVSSAVMLEADGSDEIVTAVRASIEALVGLRSDRDSFSYNVWDPLTEMWGPNQVQVLDDAIPAGIVFLEVLHRADLPAAVLIETLGYHAQAVPAALEQLTGRIRNEATPTEAVLAGAVALQSVLENVVQVYQLQSAALESSGQATVSLAAAAAVESLAGIFRPVVGLVEALISRQLGSASALESLAERRALQQVAIEIGRQVLAAEIAAIEAGGQPAITASVATTIEVLAQAARAELGLIEAEITLSGVRALPIEQLAGMTADAAAALEALIKLQAVEHAGIESDKGPVTIAHVMELLITADHALERLLNR